MSADDKKQAIDKLATQLRDRYMTHRIVHLRLLDESAMLDAADCGPSAKLHPRWDGGTDSRGVRHQPVWPKLAAVALAQDLEPQAWVACLFQMAWSFDHVPWPTDLKDKSVMRKARRWKQEQQLDVLYTIRTQLLNIAKEQWFREQNSSLSAAEIARMLVIDPSCDLSPLVRYLKASQYEQLDLLDKLEIAAALQYRTAPEIYQGMLGERLPQRLLQRAASLK